MYIYTDECHNVEGWCIRICAEVADIAAITKTTRLGKHVDTEQKAAMEAVMVEKNVKAKRLGDLLFEGNSWFLEMQEFVELQAEAGTAKVAHACLRGSSHTGGFTT